jgi:hypothetical protein
VTREEYREICERLAREAIAYGARMVANEELSDDVDAQCEHWIDVFLDDHLPDIDADALLAVTSHADAWLKASGSFYATVAVRAFAAFQADVWDAINRTEAP